MISWKKTSETSQMTRLMIADAHPSVRLGVKALLAADLAVALVGEADDGPRALRMTGDVQPDLLILDPMLPGWDGIAAIRQLTASQPQLKIVALSSRQEALFARALLDAGAQGFLSKTSPGSALLEAVELVLARELYVDQCVLEQEAARAALFGAQTPNFAKLSEREEEVLRLLARGLTMKTVSPSLRLSPRTVETYKTRAMLKLNLRTRADLLRFALRCGWLDDT